MKVEGSASSEPVPLPSRAGRHRRPSAAIGSWGHRRPAAPAKRKKLPDEAQQIVLKGEANHPREDVRRSDEAKSVNARRQVSKQSAICVISEDAPEHDLALLREAVEKVDQGIVIIDSGMRVCLANAKARAIWRLRDEPCAGRPLFSEFIFNIAAAGAYDLSPDELAGYVLRRFETVDNGDPTPVDIRTRDGRIIRAQVTPLPSGGRMLTHTDITDLLQHADHFRSWQTSMRSRGCPMGAISLQEHVPSGIASAATTRPSASP
jgi:PAS domain-containing protein